MTMDQCKSAFRQKLGDGFTDDLNHELEKFFYGADDNNVSAHHVS